MSCSNEQARYSRETQWALDKADFYREGASKFSLVPNGLDQDSGEDSKLSAKPYIAYAKCLNSGKERGDTFNESKALCWNSGLKKDNAYNAIKR